MGGAACGCDHVAVIASPRPRPSPVALARGLRRGFRSIGDSAGSGLPISNQRARVAAGSGRRDRSNSDRNRPARRSTECAFAKLRTTRWLRSIGLADIGPVNDPAAPGDRASGPQNSRLQAYRRRRGPAIQSACAAVADGVTSNPNRRASDSSRAFMGGSIWPAGDSGRIKHSADRWPT